jgi:hypothetical protein
VAVVVVGKHPARVVLAVVVLAVRDLPRTHWQRPAQSTQVAVVVVGQHLTAVALARLAVQEL